MYGYSSSSYAAIDTMSLFSGYWLGVIQSGVQLIEKPSASVVIPLAKQAQAFATNWELPIKLATASLVDNIALIGIKPNTSAGYDPLYDAPRPPRNPGGNFLELYFTESGGNYPANLGTKYARDFRDSASAQWNFTVESSQNSDITISWDNTILEGLSGSLDLDLTDIAGNQTIDMQSMSAYTFSYSAPRQFLINTIITLLPLEITSYKATVEQTTAYLQWTTATEVNNSGFEVQRRTMSSNQSPAAGWGKVGFVAGNGTSNVPHNYSFTDQKLATGTYSYRLKQIDRSGAFIYSQALEISIEVPKVFALSQNYPDPFNPTTTIQFTVPSDGRAMLKVFNTLGQTVATLFDGVATAGEYHQATFDASGLSSGIYFARLEFGGKMLVKKMLLLK